MEEYRRLKDLFKKNLGSLFPKEKDKKKKGRRGKQEAVKAPPLKARTPFDWEPEEPRHPSLKGMQADMYRGVTHMTIYVISYCAADAFPRGVSVHLLDACIQVDWSSSPSRPAMPSGPASREGARAYRWAISRMCSRHTYVYADRQEGVV
jgi:hypothetical protein